MAPTVYSSLCANSSVLGVRMRTCCYFHIIVAGSTTKSKYRTAGAIFSIIRGILPSKTKKVVHCPLSVGKTDQ